MTAPDKEPQPNEDAKTSILGDVASAIGDIGMAGDAASSLVDLVKEAAELIVDITPDV